MSVQDNIAVIQRNLEAFGRGDIESILRTCTSDCEFDIPGPAVIPQAGKHVGIEQIRDNFFGRIAATSSNRSLQVERVVAQDDDVIVIGRYAATVNATGKQFDVPIALIFELQDGKVKRYLGLGDTAALAAAYSGAAAAAS